MPTWAIGMVDIWVTLPFDGMQTIMVAAINNRLGLAIADLGTYRTVMDLRMAQAYGLPVHCAINGDCGRYVVPSNGVEHDYTGVVEQSFVMRLGEHVSFWLTRMRKIDHPFVLFLLGANILCGGR